MFAVHTAHPQSTWNYAHDIKPGKRLRAWLTSNQRLRRSTLHIRYIADRTTPKELGKALQDAGISCEVHAESVVLYTAR
jgi:hypothetical protein